MTEKTRKYSDAEYAWLVQNNYLKLEEIPEEYRENVKYILNYKQISYTRDELKEKLEKLYPTKEEWKKAVEKLMEEF